MKNGFFTITRFYLFSVTANTFIGLDCIYEQHGRFAVRVTQWVTPVKQDLLTFREYLSSPMFVGAVRVFCVVLLCVFTFCVRVVMSATISTQQRCSVRLQLFVGGFMSYLRYTFFYIHKCICLRVAVSKTYNVLCCVYSFVFVLCGLCCWILWSVNFRLSFRYSLTFILVLCGLCCRFLWSVNFRLPLRYSLAFIQTMMVDNAININKTNNRLTPLLTEQKSHGILRWKSKSWS